MWCCPSPTYGTRQLWVGYQPIEHRKGLWQSPGKRLMHLMHACSRGSTLAGHTCCNSHTRTASPLSRPHSCSTMLNFQQRQRLGGASGRSAAAGPRVAPTRIVVPRRPVRAPIASTKPEDVSIGAGLRQRPRNWARKPESIASAALASPCAGRGNGQEHRFRGRRRVPAARGHCGLTMRA